jgi:hypothetical protein
LAHRGRPDALDLGGAILGDLPCPCWAVRGEGDDHPRGSAWSRRWGWPWFSRAWGGYQVIGLDTVWRRTPRGPTFEMGAAQRRWLARELAGLHPGTPLIILSHAPLTRIFHPWQQWTDDAGEIVPRLARFRRVLCLHGHVHGVGISGKIPPGPPLVKGGSAAGTFLGRVGWPASPPLAKGDLGGFSEAWLDFNNRKPFVWTNANRKPQTENGLIHYSLPATAWPRPLAVQGTPAAGRPGLGPRGCGWALVTLSPQSQSFQPVIWPA